MPVLNVEALIEDRVEALYDYHKSEGVQRAELDLSGGLDSAVMLGLLKHAVGAKNITTVYQGIHSSTSSLERAREVAEVFKVPLVEIDLSDMVDGLLAQMRTSLIKTGFDTQSLDEIQKDPTVLGSIRSCLRAPIGRGFNRMSGGGIRHGTGNECEDRWTRFYQKGGDGEVDTNPLSHLTKGEVFQLAIALKVPMSILKARPSPDLWGTPHTDEDEFQNYFGFAPPPGEAFYSYINLDTGEYRNKGLIERVSRFSDHAPLKSVRLGGSPLVEKILERYLVEATQSNYFIGLGDELTRKLVKAAIRIEKSTRHKWNPNMPTLGERGDLIEKGILTNFLP